MSFDGIVTSAITRELKEVLLNAKVEKIYQPEKEEIVLHLHSSGQKRKLLMSVNSSNPRTYLIEGNESNPQNPPAFCMLLRKHLQNSRIRSIEQYQSERIIEFGFETINELGLKVNKMLILEIMGKHSNLVLVELPSYKILDSIKRISLDVNRYRQTLPGLIYVYPPSHEKISYFGLTKEAFDAAVSAKLEKPEKAVFSSIQGISPIVANEIVSSPRGSYNALYDIVQRIEKGDFKPAVYFDENGNPVDFHAIDMEITECYASIKYFDTVNLAAAYYYEHKTASNRLGQKARSLLKSVSVALDKQYLKKQRLSEDLLRAQNADIYKLYGELITANLHNIDAGKKSVTVHNYYDGTDIEIPLEIRNTPVQNAQKYYKKYAKSKTAIIEKNHQLEETGKDIDYLESVLTHIENSVNAEDIDDLRIELIENGYVRRRKNVSKTAKTHTKPHEYITGDGFKVFVGRNNKENDSLTFKTASSNDIWFHTKDIPGSHVILFTAGKEIPRDSIFEAASIAAYFSKAKMSSNVPVDYVKVKHVKKPNGAKPGMVIFTNNKTIFVQPKLPDKRSV